MKDLKKPLGTAFMGLGAVFMLIGIGSATLLAPERGFSMGNFAPMHVILMVSGVLMGLLGLFLLLAQTAD